jgi:hypothetical protein
MIPHKIEPRRRYQGRKLPYKVNGMENNMRCSIAPSMPETVQHTSVRKPLQGKNIDAIEEQPSIGIAAFPPKWESRNGTNCRWAYGANCFLPLPRWEKTNRVTTRIAMKSAANKQAGRIRDLKFKTNVFRFPTWGAGRFLF